MLNLILPGLRYSIRIYCFGELLHDYCLNNCMRLMCLIADRRNFIVQPVVRQIQCLF
jgi:hypothetical protein